MTIIETLFKFEKKYPFLYGIEVNGFPVYTCFRDELSLVLSGKDQEKNTVLEKEKGRIYPKRMVDSFFKMIRFRKAKTLVFTSTMFRRDYGRNLAAEYLIDQYPDTVIFEWPSRTKAYDTAYFKDKIRYKYCPLDYYVLVYKIYSKLHKKERSKLENQCGSSLKKAFEDASIPKTDTEKKAIELLIKEMPVSYASTVISHKVFRKLFSKYKYIDYAVDFWGSARENIIPVLPGKFETIELQHGIITECHPGYIYSAEANHICKQFFDRKLLVYGENTKQILVKNSIFVKEQIEVIGNPRIFRYKQEYGVSHKNKKYILFTSQPFEQDVRGNKYYCEIIPYLQKIQRKIELDDKWGKYKLAIKLHPRENNGVKELYADAIPGCVLFDNATQLYELLGESFVHITVSSTTLYEAALFDIPTLLVPYQNYCAKDIYGFDVNYINEDILGKLLNFNYYEKYLTYLKKETRQYM